MTTNLSTTSNPASPYLLLKETGKVRLTSTQVNVQIDGVIADVTVNQTYTNEDEKKLDATYIFAGSTRAAVYAMEIRIGDRMIEAKVKEKQAARKEFEEARQQGKTAGLLEQHRPNVFQMEVSNILPGDRVEVAMRYTEVLEYRDAIYEFVYPGVVGPRYSKDGEGWVKMAVKQLFDVQPDFDLKASVLSPVPVQTISSVSHQISIDHPNEKQVLVSLANPLDRQGSSDFVLRYGLQGKTVQSGMLTYSHPDGEQFFMMMVQPPAKPTIETIPSREYIFIVDVSGSMHGFPLDVAKKTLENLISSLRPTDLFNVILFSFSAGILSDKSFPATPENIRKALSILQEQQSGGGTELLNALQAAFNFPATPDFARTFVVITDGFVTVENQAFQMIRDKRDKANVFGAGIGGSVNRHLIEGLSYAGAGEAYFITNQTEAETTGKKLVNDISLPVWTHIAIDWGDMQVFDIEPSSTPDLFEAKPLVVFGKYWGKAKGRIKINGQTGLGTSEQIIDTANAVESGSQALRYLWARNRIKYLSDYAHYFEDDVRVYFRSEDRPKYEHEITGLGLKYNLLTKYTSLIAVDDENDVRKENMPAKLSFRTCCKPDLSRFERKAGNHTVHKMTKFIDNFIGSIFEQEEDKTLRREELIKKHLIKNIGFINDNIQLPDNFHFDTAFILNSDGSISKPDIVIVVTVTVSTNGKISNVMVLNCPDAVFEAELKKALMKITVPKITKKIETEISIRVRVSSNGKITSIG